MYSYPRAILYAIILWAMTFLVTFLIYPVRTDNAVLFVTLRMLTMVVLCVFLTVMYFRDVEEHLVREGITLGAIWLVLGILLDQGPFVWGLMHLSFLDYLVETGISNLVYPVITVGAGLLLSADKSTVEDSEASRWASQSSPVLPGPEKGLSHGHSDPKAHV